MALGKGIRILCIKDYIRSERIGVITNSKSFELKKKKEEKKKMNNQGSYFRKSL